VASSGSVAAVERLAPVFKYSEQFHFIKTDVGGSLDSRVVANLTHIAPPDATPLFLEPVDLGQAVRSSHTCASVTKQYIFAPVKGW